MRALGLALLLMCSCQPGIVEQATDEDPNPRIDPPVGNQFPTLNAGLDQVITLPQASATFDAVAEDRDGTIVLYAWQKVSGGNATLGDASGASLTVTGLEAGDYVFSVTATDNGGASVSDQVALTVQPQPANVLPTVSAGGDQSITLPTSTATFSASASDADGTVESIEWIKVSGGNATLSGTSPMTASGLGEGTYVFRVTVTDDRGGQASDDVMLTVNPMEVAANDPPAVNAGADKTITLPTASTTFTASATDSDGTVQSYAWTKMSGGNATLAGASTPTLTVSGVSAGSYVFRVTVTDDDGATASDTVMLTVNAAPPNQPPTVSAGADQTITLPSGATFTAMAADADGTVQSFAWTKMSGGNANLAGANTATLTVSGLAAGSYVFRVTVTDDDGATASDTVMLTVNASGGVRGVTNPSVAFAGTETTMSAYRIYNEVPGGSIAFVADPLGQLGQVMRFVMPKANGDWKHVMVQLQDRRANYTGGNVQVTTWESGYHYKQKLLIPNDPQYRQHELNTLFDPHCEPCEPNNFQLFTSKLQGGDVCLWVTYSTDGSYDPRGPSRGGSTDPWGPLGDNELDIIIGADGNPTNRPATLPSTAIAFLCRNDLRVADLQGRWVDFEVLYRPSSYATGRLKVWIDGKPYFWDGPNNYRYNQNRADALPVSVFQAGLYGSATTAAAGTPTSWELYMTPPLIELGDDIVYVP